MFITLEGIEGSGKTTQIENIVNFFSCRGLECITTREPGGTAIGGKIRSILLDPGSVDMVPEAELLLYVADRVQHLETLVRPELAAGKIVVCDRFFDATIVYQGFARGLERRLIYRLHQLVCRDTRPDVTFLLDLPPEEGLKRAWTQINNGNRTSSESRFEEEALAFHQKVRDGYLTLAGMEPGRFRIIDAANDQQQVRQDILEHLTGFFPSP